MRIQNPSGEAKESWRFCCRRFVQVGEIHELLVDICPYSHEISGRKVPVESVEERKFPMQLRPASEMRTIYGLGISQVALPFPRLTT